MIRNRSHGPLGGHSPHPNDPHEQSETDKHIDALNTSIRTQRSAQEKGAKNHGDVHAGTEFEEAVEDRHGGGKRRSRPRSPLHRRIVAGRPGRGDSVKDAATDSAVEGLPSDGEDEPDDERAFRGVDGDPRVLPPDLPLQHTAVELRGGVVEGEHGSGKDRGLSRSMPGRRGASGRPGHVHEFDDLETDAAVERPTSDGKEREGGGSAEENASRWFAEASGLRAADVSNRRAAAPQPEGDLGGLRSPLSDALWARLFHHPIDRWTWRKRQPSPTPFTPPSADGARGLVHGRRWAAAENVVAFQAALARQAVDKPSRRKALLPFQNPPSTEPAASHLGLGRLWKLPQKPFSIFSPPDTGALPSASPHRSYAPFVQAPTEVATSTSPFGSRTFISGRTYLEPTMSADAQEPSFARSIFGRNIAPSSRLYSLPLPARVAVAAKVISRIRPWMGDAIASTAVWRAARGPFPRMSADDAWIRLGHLARAPRPALGASTRTVGAR